MGLEIVNQIQVGAVVSRCSLSPDAKFCALGTVDGEIHLLDMLRERIVSSFLAHEGLVDDVAFTKNGSNICTCSSAAGIPRVNFWDLTGEKKGAIIP